MSATPPGEEPIDELEREVGITALDDEFHQETARYGRPSRYSCPECGGVLWDVTGKGPFRFRCEVGHAHSAASLGEAQTEVVEAAMWAALRALEDKADLARKRSARATERGVAMYAAGFSVQEEAAEQHAAALRALLRLDGRTGIRPRTGQEEASEPVDVMPGDRRFETGQVMDADTVAGAETRAGTTSGAD